MNIVIENATKARVVKFGPVRTFGDYDKRQRMNESELVVLFDKAWKVGLKEAVSRSHQCTIEVALSKLNRSNRPFLDSNQELRQFRYLEIDFIAQLRKISEDEYELTQLWKIQSGDDHPKTLWVTFDSVEEREIFAQVANSIGWKDEDLGLALLRDFVAKLRQA